MLSHENHKVILATPASWKGARWRDALPAGNGIIGASVYGGVHSETILINHTNLWQGLYRDTLPDIHDSLAGVRTLLEAEEFEKASDFTHNQLKASGYNAQIPEPFPLGNLVLHMPVHKGFTNYRRTLAMDTGEIEVCWKDSGISYSRSLFVPRNKNLIAMKLAASSGNIEAEILLTAHSEKDSEFPLKKEVWETAPQVVFSPEKRLIVYSAKLKSLNPGNPAVLFGAMVTYQGALEECKQTQDGLLIKSSSDLEIIVHPFCGEDFEGAADQALAYLQDTAESYDQLFEEHLPLHAELYHSAELMLTDSTSNTTNEVLLMDAYQGMAPLELMQKLWYFGRYLSISAIHQDGNPCALYGLWSGNYHPIWSQHVANENIQMIHSHLLTGNLTSLIKPVFSYIDELLPDFRETAKKIFGCRGIVIPAYTAPGIGLPTVLNPVILNWTGAAAWLAKLYYDYAQYSQDTSFLEQTAVPFLMEIYTFYKDFLIIDDQGYYAVAPSVSPENSPGNYVPPQYDGLSHPMPTTINATMDIALIKEVVMHLIESSIQLNMDHSFIIELITFLKHVPPYRINKDGALAEWIDPRFDDNYQHRHIAHIYPIFPGNEITAKDQPELFEASKKAIEKRLELALDQQCNWSLVHIAQILTRFGDGDKALECIDLLARSCIMNNLFSASNDWRDMGICLSFDLGTFQIDGNMGVTAVFQDMLFQTNHNTVSLLPALPGRLNKGAFKNFLSPFCKASCTWDLAGDIPEVEILIEIRSKASFSLVLPKPHTYGKWVTVYDSANLEMSRISKDPNVCSYMIHCLELPAMVSFAFICNS